MNAPTINDRNHDPMQRYIDAVTDREPEQQEVDRAQRNLMSRLESGNTATTTLNPGWRWGAIAAAVLLVPVLVWMPGTNGNLAFAEVQKFFFGFETLTARMTTTVGGEAINAMTVHVDDERRARLDSGGAFSYVIDAERATMLQLFHDRKLASFVPLGGSGSPEADTALGWLADIRRFQGEAELLDEPTVIRGQEAWGFELQAGGMDMTLWAAESGEPLRLQLQPRGAAAAAGVETRMDFEFDVTLDESLFSLTPPAGYTLLDGPAAAERRD